MGDLILAGVLIWLIVFVWWGTDLALRADGRYRLAGALLIALAVVPTFIALWVGT